MKIAPYNEAYSKVSMKLYALVAQSVILRQGHFIHPFGNIIGAFVLTSGSGSCGH